MPTADSPSWAPIARLLRPQGRRGELLSEPLCDLPEVFAKGQTVALCADGATEPPPNAPLLQLEEHWLPTGKNAGRIVLKLSACDSISQAEALAGQVVLLPTQALPALEPDTFFVGDLLGCDLFDGTTLVGRIIDVQFATGPDGRTRLEDAAPLLGVEPISSHLKAASPLVEAEEPEPILVPFVRAWLDKVDVSGRRVIMHLPAGLFDTADDSNV